MHQSRRHPGTTQHSTLSYFSTHFREPSLTNPSKTPLFQRKSAFYLLASALQLWNAKDASPDGAKPKPIKKEKTMETEKQAIETCSEEPRILEEIQVEELAIDGICGVY
jgi:mycofactocin precursor